MSTYKIVLIVHGGSAEERSSGGYPASSEAHAPCRRSCSLPCLYPVICRLCWITSVREGSPWSRSGGRGGHWRRAAQGHRLHAGDLLWVTGQPHPVVFSTWTSTVSTGMTRTDRRLHLLSEPTGPQSRAPVPASMLTARFLATTAIGKQPSRVVSHWE